MAALTRTTAIDCTSGQYFDFRELTREQLEQIFFRCDAYGDFNSIYQCLVPQVHQGNTRMSFDIASGLYWQSCPALVQIEYMHAYRGIQYVAQRALFNDDIDSFLEAVKDFFDGPTAAFAATEGAAADSQFPTPPLTADDVLRPQPLRTPQRYPLGSAENPIVIDEVEEDDNQNMVDLTEQDQVNLAAEFLANMNSPQPNKRAKN
jgi:hypothetical protein